MIKYEAGITTITCDKCGFEESADTDSYNDAFFESGWGLYMNARKYKHRCRDCQPVKDRKAHDFVKTHFPPNH